MCDTLGDETCVALSEFWWWAVGLPGALPSLFYTSFVERGVTAMQRFVSPLQGSFMLRADSWGDTLVVPHKSCRRLGPRPQGSRYAYAWETTSRRNEGSARERSMSRPFPARRDRLYVVETQRTLRACGGGHARERLWYATRNSRPRADRPTRDDHLSAVAAGLRITPR